MIHRPPDIAFDDHALVGTLVTKKSVGHWIVVFFAALSIGVAISGVASALRGWSTKEKLK